MKKSVLRNFEKFTGKQVFSCEFRKISKNTFCTEHLGTTAPENKSFWFWGSANLKEQSVTVKLPFIFSEITSVVYIYLGKIQN